MFNTLYNKERCRTFALHTVFTIHTNEPVDHDQTVLELTLFVTVFFFLTGQASSSKRLTSRDQWPARPHMRVQRKQSLDLHQPDHFLDISPSYLGEYG